MNEKSVIGSYDRQYGLVALSHPPGARSSAVTHEAWFAAASLARRHPMPNPLYITLYNLKSLSVSS